MASTTDDTRDGLLRAEYGVENDTYYYLGTQWVARKRSGLRPDLIFLSGFEALLPRALAKRLVEALVGLKSGGESVTWFLTDHLGSNIATVDAAGAVIERSQFAPYGERWGKVAERGPGFTGHYEDQSTLTYMKARYYGGIVGRFLSPDPVLTDTADGRNFNRYWYANNNPQRFVDPDGRESACFSNGVGCGLRPWTDSDQDAANTAFGGLTSAAGLAVAPALMARVFTAVLQNMIRATSAVNLAAEVVAGDALGGASVGAVAFAGARGLSWSIDELVHSAGLADRGGLTAAGRALQKHGSRVDSAFPRADGNPASINQKAQAIVEEILGSSGNTITTRHHARFGDVTEVRAPDGRGVRYGADGRFIGFLEPTR